MSRLLFLLQLIVDNDKNYITRNHLIYEAMVEAMRQGFQAGVRNPGEHCPGWLVVFIGLPTGQISWHVPEYPDAWDNHTTEEKFDRIEKFVEQNCWGAAHDDV